MPQGFNIGPLNIRFYALLIILGAIVGSWIAAKQAKKHGKDPEIVLDLLPWLLIGGIIGARLWHVFTPSASNIAAGTTTQHYLSNPIEILKMWKGGLGIPGGVIGGALALWLYTKAKKINFLQWADFIAPGLLVGQAIGRWGNFVNQEVYGKPSDLPWAITIDPQFRLNGFEHVSKYHPLFLYESLLALIGAGILIWADKKWRNKLFKGDLLFLYLIIYPVIRFFLEFLRLDPSPVNGINVNQTAMMVVGILALIALILRHTVWADRLAAKERADETLKLDEAEVSEEGSEIINEDLTDERIVETDPELLDKPTLEERELFDADLIPVGGISDPLQGMEEEIEPIAETSEEEYRVESEELVVENNEWIADELVEEPQEWVSDHLPDVEVEDLPEITEELLDKDDSEPTVG